MATKYLIFSVIFFGYAMFAYNRKGVSFAIPKLIEEGLGNEQVGLILSSQNFAYAISKFLGGIISDKLSSRILFSSGLLISGLAAMVFPLMNSVASYTAIWFLNGLAQGVGWPAIAKLLKNWFDPAELGTWWSLASASSNLSGCVAPFIASYVILNYGWPASLQFVGALTLLAATIAFIFIADSPSITKISTKNSPKKSPKREQPASKKQGSSALKILLTCKFTWVIAISFLVASCIKTILTDWSQLYLMRDCHQSSLVANSFVSSFEFGGFFGGIAAGFLSDLYMKHKGNFTHGHPRMTIALLFAIATALGLYLFALVDMKSSPIFINQTGILLGAAVYAQIAILGVVATQSVDSSMSGTSHAIAALAANIGSIVAGLPVASIAKHYSWTQVFLILQATAIAIIGFLVLARNVRYKVELTGGSKKKD